MELKQNICVYIEIAGGALSPLSIELLGKARQLADAKGKKVVAFVAGADTAKASQEAISYGADAVAAVEDGALAAYDSVLYTKAIAALAEKYEPSVILIGGSPDGRDLGGRLSAQLGVGLVADCTDVRFEGDDDTLTWIRPAYTGSSSRSRRRRGHSWLRSATRFSTARRQIRPGLAKSSRKASISPVSLRPSR